MTAAPRLLIHGATGRMGRALVRLCAQSPDSGRVVAAVARTVSQRVIDGVPQFAMGERDGVPAFDVAIDFSVPEAFDGIVALCTRRRAALVSGTTGLTPAQQQALAAAGQSIPLLWAANFSVGVAVLSALVERAAASLRGWDCDILEQHHVHKRDAPSGTALALGARAEAAGARPRYASVRAGDIVGEHLVQFTAAGERVELVHRATDREIFARGALAAATRLAAKPPGLYSFAGLILDG